MAKAARFFQQSQARNTGPVPVFPPELLEGRPMRLNKFLAHAGLGNRRACEHLVKAGQIKVNQELVKNPGHLVKMTDEIAHLGVPLKTRPGLAYVLLNRAAGLDEAKCGQLIRHPDLPEIDWQSVFDRGPGIAGLSLLTNDHGLNTYLRSVAGPTTAALKLLFPEGESLTTQEISLLGAAADHPQRLVNAQADGSGSLRLAASELVYLEETIASVFNPGVVADVVQLLQFDKRDLPRGFYRFLQPEEIRQLRHFS